MAKLTFRDALERYAAAVTPTCRGGVQEHNWVLQPQKQPIALHRIDSGLRKTLPLIAISDYIPLLGTAPVPVLANA